MHGHVQHVALGLVLTNRASGAAWASAIPTRTCWASSTWCRSARASASSIWRPRSLPTGGAYHQYQPLTKKGNNDIGGNFNDDPHWLIVGVAAYLKETGDWSILDEPVPYDNQPGLRAAALRAPAAQLPLHAGAARAARAAADRPRRLERLPESELLLRHAGTIVPDHDQQGRQGGRVGLHRRTVRAGGEGTGGHRQAARPGGRSARLPGGRPRAWRRRSASTAGTASGSCAPTTISGSKIGSKECAEGKIFIETQGFCVLAGIGLEDGMARKALDSVRKHLATPHGIVLQQPAYSRYYLELGEISSYPPGYKENAGIFCHNNPWVIIAEAMTGQRRRGARLLFAHQSLGARTDQRPASLRAVCLCADDRRPRRADAWRGEEFLADGHRGVELTTPSRNGFWASGRTMTACASRR